MNIVEFRKQYPQYNDMSDIKLADSFYAKHYSDMPREEFDTQFIAPTLPAPEVDVYGGIDPEGVMAEKAETQKALDFIGGLTEAQMTGPTEGKVGFQEGGTSDATPIGVFGETAVQTAKDVAGTVTKAGAGLIKGATLGAIDPEAGTIGIPFTDIKKKVAQKLSVSLQEVLGTSPEIAENPYIQVAPEMVGTILPWQKAQKLVSAVGKAKTVAGRVAETAVTGALIGAAEVRDKDESQLRNALEYAAVGAGLHLAGEAAIPLVNYIKSVAKYKTITKDISADDLYKAFTGQAGATPKATKFVSGLTRQQKVNMAKNVMRKGEGVKVKEKVPRAEARKVAERPVVKPEATKEVKPKEVAAIEKKVAKIKEIPSDKKISKGIPSKVKEGEKLVEVKPVKKPSQKEVEAGGVLRKEKEVKLGEKEPWEHTGVEFAFSKRGKGIASKTRNEIHESSVRKALEEGKPVSAEVLEDYPGMTVDVKRYMAKRKPVTAPGKEAVKPVKPYSVGSSVKVGKSPQVNTILEEMPATKQEKELGERFFKVKNEKTGEIQEVTFEDITPIKLKPVKPEPTMPLKEKAAKMLAEERGSITLREDEAFVGKNVPVWEDFKKMRLESKKARKVSPKKVIKELNKAFIDVSGNFKREAMKYGEEGYRLIVRKTLFAGAHGSAIEDLNAATKAIYGGINNTNHDYLDVYLYAKRSLEILKTRPKFKFFGNKAKADFEQLLDSIPANAMKEITKRAEKNWKVYNNLAKDLYNEGMLTKEGLAEITARGQNYSPREILEYLDPGSAGEGGKLSVPDSGLKTLSEEGSLKAVETDSALLLSQAITRTKTRIFKNRAAKALYDLAAKQPGNGLVKLARVIRTTKDGKPVYQPAPHGYEKTYAMINGVKKEMIMPTDMAKEWIKNDPLINSTLAETASILTGTKLLKAMATGLNPEFALTNFPRDLAFVWVNTQEYSNFAPKAALQMANDVLSSLGTASGFRPIKGAKAIISGEDLSVVMKDMFNRKGWAKEYIARGGSMEFLTQQGRFAPKMKGHIGKLQDVMGYAGGTSELVVRIATMKRAYENMKKGGRTDHEQMMDEAVFIARNYLDFSQGGYLAKAADPFSPYFNAAIQGTRGAARAVETNPKSTILKLSQMAGMAVGLTYANYHYNRECYLSIPPRDRVNNWIFTSPFWYTDKNGNKVWLYMRIPKDQTQRIVTAAAEYATAKSLGEEVDTAQITQASKDIVAVSAPPIYKAFKGYELNKDFYRGEDIWRGSREEIEKEQEFYKNYTHDFYIKAGEKTGMSPERLKYAMSQFFTTGNIWTSAVGGGWNEIMRDLPEEQQEEITQELILKRPGIRKLFRHTDPYHKFSKEIKDVTIEERTKKFVMMRDFNDIVQRKLKGTAENKDIVAFIKKNPKDAKVLKEYYKTAILLKDMPEKRYWKKLAKVPAAARARLFWSRWQDESPEERIKSLKTAKKISGFYSDAFNKKFGELRSQTMKEEANKGKEVMTQNIS